MTRPFRLEEDERRYFALRSEFFIRLVQSGVPAQTVHEIMRNFGKLEDIMFFEGVRQGVVAAMLADEDQRDTRAIALHADTYGHSATPLTRLEDAVVSEEEYARFKDHTWLDKEPMLFGPLTLTEAIEQYGEDLVVKRAPVRAREAAPAPAREPTRDEPLDESTESILDELASGEDPDVVFARHNLPTEPDLQDPIELPLDGGDAPLDTPTGESDQPIHQPQLLDRARDVLLRSTAPKTWPDLVLLLMRELRVDAAHIDEVMSTPMGMTVVSQCNLFHLHPGALPEVKAVPPPTR